MDTENKTMEMDNTQLIQDNKKSNVNKRALFTAAAAILGGGAATAAAVEGKKWYDDWMQEHRQQKPEDKPIEEEKFVHEPKEEPKPEPKKTEEPKEVVPEKPEYDIDAIGGVEQIEIGGEVVNALPVMVNGHEGYLIDRDGDGKADYMIYDKNDNNQYDEGELLDLEEEGLLIEMPAYDIPKGYEIDAIIDQEYQDIEGQQVLVTKAIVNDHPAVLYDLEGDGNVDYMVIDINEDGVISEDEMIDTTANEIALVVPVPEDDNPAVLNEIKENGLNITEVHDFEVYEDADGNLISYARVDANGHAAIIMDTDGDGFGDALAMDVDDSYSIESGEAIDLREIGAGQVVPMREIAEAGGFNYDTIIGDYPPIDDDGSDIAMVDGEEVEELSEAPEDNYEMLAVVEEDEATNDTAGFDPNYTGEEVDEDLVADIDETIEEDIVSDDNIG